VQNERAQLGDHVSPPRSENTLHHDRSRQPLDAAAHPARPHHACSETNGTSSILSTPRPRPINPPTFLQRSRHLGEIQVQLTRISPKARSCLERTNGLDHHFSLGRSPIKERDFSPRREEISTNVPTKHYHRKPHTRSKIIPL